MRNHYDVLGLTGPPSNYAQEDIKLAYKRALLLHHPDKSKDATPLFSVDEITQAYTLLSDPKTRNEYDRQRALSSQQRFGTPGEGCTGLETVDLDDLTPVQEEESNIRGGEHSEEAWVRNCRCGRVFKITESQLEREIAVGELYVPCEGCSLWLRVLFQASDG